MRSKDSEHFEKFWVQLPHGSPLHELGKDTLETLLLPADHLTLIQIDLTRKFPYSIILTEIFIEEEITLLRPLLERHHQWLIKNDPDGLKDYSEQLYKCSSNFQQKDKTRLGVAEAVESFENRNERQATRQAIRKILEEHDPKLLADMLSTDKRDLFDRVEKIYSIHKGEAHRPKKK